MKVLVSVNIPEAGINDLTTAGHEVTINAQDMPMPKDELIRLAKEHEALLSAGIYKLDKQFLNECNHLKIISQFAAGYDNIDIEEATRLQIPVGNAPNAMNNATADVAFGLMLAVSRKMIHMHKIIEKGEWGYFRPRAHLGVELKGSTLGIFGLGRIGMEMARRCKGAYHMNILYCNRTPNKQAEEELSAQRVRFEQLLAQSDVISVHCSLSEETKNLFNQSIFNKMKSTAIFINTSRGSVHNEQDLIEALRNDVIWGAGLDVTNPEPMLPDNPLLTMENVAVTPHIGSATVIARNEMSRLAAANIIAFARGNKIPNWVNPF